MAWRGAGRSPRPACRTACVLLENPVVFITRVTEDACSQGRAGGRFGGGGGFIFSFFSSPSTLGILVHCAHAFGGALLKSTVSVVSAGLAAQRVPGRPHPKRFPACHTHTLMLLLLLYPLRSNLNLSASSSPFLVSPFPPHSLPPFLSSLFPPSSSALPLPPSPPPFLSPFPIVASQLLYSAVFLRARCSSLTRIPPLRHDL